MESTHRAPLRRRPWPAVAIVVLAFAGCGSDDRYANELRPPAPIVVTASIDDSKVSVSPARFGAGPINFVVTNQTDAAQQLTLQTAGRSAGIRQQTGPIAPRETASLKVDLKQGEYEVSVVSEEIRPATLAVGAERPSAQNELLQP